MEKPAATTPRRKMWNKFQSAVSLQNLPFSPRGGFRADFISQRFRSNHNNKGFSGPMIPDEARRKPRNFEDQEPTSPKVSCMGQVKPKKAPLLNQSEPVKAKKARKGIKELIFGAGRKRKSDLCADRAKSPDRVGAPSLVNTRRFASSRDGLAGFDWTAAQIAPEVDREYYSDGERGDSDGEDGDAMYFSAPMRVGGAGLDLEPRKEVNLWDRRAMARLKPLELKRKI